MVPEGFAPDGKARMVSLKFATDNGTSSDSSVGLKWGPTGTDTTLTNYNRVPTKNTVGSGILVANANGYLPSDNFSSKASLIDPEAKYYRNDYTHMIPSPYHYDTANPDYYGAIEGYNNALSDFDGSGNTATLVGLGSDYTAANAANNYSDGVSGAKWYLPAMGELGYLMPRFKKINNAIAVAGGVALPSEGFWSSTEYGSRAAFYLYTSNGNVSNYTRSFNTYFVRPFAIID